MLFGRSVRIIVVAGTLGLVWGLSLQAQVPSEVSTVGRFTDVNKDLGPGINSTDTEWNPVVSADGQTLLFSSGGGRGGKGGFDIYMATRDDDAQQFDDAVRLTDINSSVADFPGALSADGQTLYFWSNRTGNYDIYQATWDNDTQRFTGGIRLAELSSTSDEYPGGLSPDGLMLFLSSWRAGLGGADIFVATREAIDQPFGTPVNLKDFYPGDQVNSAFDEWVTSVSSDGLALFFFEWANYRQGPGTLGEIYVATRTATDEPFGEPVNLNDFSLGSEINVAGIEDMAPAISPAWPLDGSKLLFVSNRQSGNWDIWQATWVTNPPEAVLAVPETVVESEEVELNGAGSFPRGAHTLVSWDWDFGDGTAAQGETVSHTYSRAGVYDLSFTVTDERGGSHTQTQSLLVSFSEGDVAPWIQEDIGDVTRPGGARLEGDCLVVQGAGGEIESRADSFHYVYQTMTGNCTLVAQITDWSDSEVRSKIGLMVRENLNEDARFGSVLLDRRFGFTHRFFQRDEEGGTVQRTTNEAYSSPNLWLKIHRRADMIKGSISEDGENWTLADMVRLEGLPEEVYVGIAVTGQEDTGPFSVATICNVSFTTPTFLRGDANAGGMVDISDAITMLRAVFQGVGMIPCEDAADSNDDGSVDVSDAIHTLSVLFLGEGEIPAPGADVCGTDPSEDMLICDAFRPCE